MDIEIKQSRNRVLNTKRGGVNLNKKQLISVRRQLHITRSRDLWRYKLFHMSQMFLIIDPIYVRRGGGGVGVSFAPS